MALEFSISSLTFSDGTIVQLKPGAVVAFVGPNNVGKTAALRDITAVLNTELSAKHAKVVKKAAFIGSGTSDDLDEWLEAHAHRDDRNPNWTEYRRMGGNARGHDLQESWLNRASGYIGRLGNFLVSYADVDQRAHVVGQGIGNIDFRDTVPSSPIHYLYLSGELEERLNRISRDVFGEPLTLQRLGTELRLRLGTPDAPIPPLNRPTREYALAELALPILAEQGHGIRSFLGLVLTMLAVRYPVMLIDEPEVFLHPPQRRELGRFVTEIAKETGAQVVVATHDTDFLWGLLDMATEPTVVRITRAGSVNYAKHIDAGTARSLWTDSILRYSRIFDGLFYKSVVVCESDADCRFYSAVTENRVVYEFAIPDMP